MYYYLVEALQIIKKNAKRGIRYVFTAYEEAVDFTINLARCANIEPRSLRIYKIPIKCAELLFSTEKDEEVLIGRSSNVPDFSGN